MTQTPTQSPLDAVIEEMKWFDARGGLAIGMHEALRRWVAALASQEAAAPSETWRAEANAHIVGLRQCSIFAEDAGPSIAKQMRESADFIEAALLASPAPVAPVEVSVKGLEWIDGETRTGFGSAYAIHSRADGMYEATGCGSFVGGPHPTREAAKAAAQQDFNDRILSSIIPATKPAVGVEELRQVRSMLDVEYHDDGRIAAVGHASDGLRKMVSFLDAALSAGTATPGGAE